MEKVGNIKKKELVALCKIIVHHNANISISEDELFESDAYLVECAEEYKQYTLVVNRHVQFTLFIFDDRVNIIYCKNGKTFRLGHLIKSDYK